MFYEEKTKLERLENLHSTRALQHVADLIRSTRKREQISPDENFLQDKKKKTEHNSVRQMPTNDEITEHRLNPWCKTRNTQNILRTDLQVALQELRKTSSHKNREIYTYRNDAFMDPTRTQKDTSAITSLPFSKDFYDTVEPEDPTHSKRQTMLRALSSWRGRKKL